MPRLTAVISGTAKDLPEHRKAAIEACLSMDILPRAAELTGDLRAPAFDSCVTEFGSPDLYIGIIGFRYGYIPEGAEKSVSELEYEMAAERGIPRLLFLMDRAHPLTIDDLDTGPSLDKLAAFRKRLESEHIVGFFKSPLELKDQLTNALAAFLQQAKAEPAPTSDSAAKTLVVGRDRREVLRVFVASPQDVQAERQRMPRIVESLNKTLGRLTGIVVELWRWETDAPPGTGEPQALIDPELDKADAVVVVFWNRFGMPTASGSTGTESEVLRSLARWRQTGYPEVMMYFCQRPATLGKEALSQRARVLDFREKVERLALTADYVEVSDFEWRVRDDLFLVLDRQRTRSAARHP